jgi:general secretion pathway protein N
MNLQFERLPFRFGWPSRIALLACALIVVIAYFPLRWLSATVANTTSCQVAVLQPEGTLWKGSAQLGFSDIQTGISEKCHTPKISSERFAWTTQCSISNLTCKWLFQYPNTARPLELTVHPGAITLGSNQIELPANMLEVAGGLMRSLHLRGKLVIRWEDLILDSSPRGLVEVHFLNVASPISPLKPIGSYVLTLQLKQAFTLAFSTINGPLLLSANGLIEKGRLSLQGEATAPQESLDSLIGLLSVIGKKDGAVYRFKI